MHQVWSFLCCITQTMNFKALFYCIQQVESCSQSASYDEICLYIFIKTEHASILYSLTFILEYMYLKRMHTHSMVQLIINGLEILQESLLSLLSVTPFFTIMKLVSFGFAHLRNHSEHIDQNIHCFRTQKCWFPEETKNSRFSCEPEMLTVTTSVGVS